MAISEYLVVTQADAAVENAMQYVRRLHREDNALEAGTVVEELRDLFADAERHFRLWGHDPREEPSKGA